jgi:hypothetical protein
MKKFIYFIAVSTCLVSACKKPDMIQSSPYESLTTGNTKYAYLKIYNLTPASPKVNFYMDGAKFTGALSSTGTESAGYAYNGFTPTLGYAATSPGTHTLTAKIIASATIDPGLQVFTTSLSLAPGKYYSVFTTGQYAGAVKSIPSSVVFEDARPALDTTKVFFRLINLCTGSPNIDVVNDLPTGTKLVSNVAYGKGSGWVEIPNPGAGTTPIITLIFSNTATSALLLRSALTFTKGRAYTVYLGGVLGDPTYPFTATIATTFTN